MLSGIQDGLRRVRGLDHVVSGTFHPGGHWPLVQYKFASFSASVALRKRTIVPKNVPFVRVNKLDKTRLGCLKC